jgi:hypothetical protein
MGTIEKAFCNLTEYYYFKGLSVTEAMKAVAKLLSKERGDKNE